MKKQTHNCCEKCNSYSLYNKVEIYFFSLTFCITKTINPDAKKVCSDQTSLKRQIWKKKILCGNFNSNLMRFKQNIQVGDITEYFTSQWFSQQIIDPTRNPQYKNQV